MKTPKTKSAWRTLAAPTIIEHIKLVSDWMRSTDWHFRVDSKFFKAVAEHIVDAKDCVLLDRKERTVSCHRGTGYAVNFEQASCPIALPGECQMLMLRISVDFDDPDYSDDDRYHSTREDFSIYAPADLELNFNQEKFELWLQTKKDERDKKHSQTDLKVLDKLLKRHPDYARQRLLVTARQKLHQQRPQKKPLKAKHSGSRRTSRSS